MNNLISNNHISNFYNYITKYLNECNYFIFNVAFINFSGIQLILDDLKKLEKKGIKGKILTSTYLNFTEVKALEKILEFNNIELKIYDSNEHNIGFHSKAYIFEFDNEYKTIIGSSNITSSAFKKNIEWNVKTISKKNDTFINSIFNEFEVLWSTSFYVDKDFLTSYSLYKTSQKNNYHSFQFNKEIKSNVMQDIALEKLKFLRMSSEKRALVIAATGSGKTYLAAFDVKKFKAKRLLFLVHRENILTKAKETFKSILPEKSMGLYTGNKKELEKEYIFSTIQTMSLNYEFFSKDDFDYIIFDEAHHIPSKSYKNVLSYFNSTFTLGLTATPNRMDGKSVYESFDNNIACEINLNDALEYKLVVPFHYYGLSDIKEIDYSGIDVSNINKLAKLLMVNKRVDYIIKKMKFYSYSGNKRRALGFCASKEHSTYMAEEFTKRGIESISLSSIDSVEKREKMISRLDDRNDKLEVIFTVDIFNEGIDIPSINTVLLLRPTSSPIIFIQQLGRGLRKYKNKDFLTLLDFIGNHNQAYLIVLSLLGNKIIDKESVKLSLMNNFANLQDVFIRMDEISKNRILEQINNENFNTMKYLKEQYFIFKSHLDNKIPKLTDFFVYDEFISPLKFINESKSYIEFLLKVEKNNELLTLSLVENFVKTIRFIDYLLPIKRVYEFVILKYLLDNEFCNEKIVINLLSKYLKHIDIGTIYHSFSYLNQDYFDKAQVLRYTKLVDFNGVTVYKSNEFSKLLRNPKYKEIIENSLSYGILSYERTFRSEDYGFPFLKLYEKYNMLNIAQLCNFNKIHSSFRGSGFLKFNNNFFLFISIEKDKFSKASKYKNDFLSSDRFTYISKPSMSQEKGDGLKLCNNTINDINLHIFVRKFVQVDKKTQGFIYLGLADTISSVGNKPIKLELKLQNKLSDNLYEEFTKIV